MDNGSVDACEKCDAILDDSDLPIQEKTKLTIDLEVTLINPTKDTKQDKEKKKKTREAREEKRNEFIRKVSALRNSGGGALLVHISGISKDDRCLAFFDEYIDGRLNELIEDGTLFVDTYTKIWLSDHLSGEKYNEYLVLIVKGTSTVSTGDFRTKVGSDENVTRPTTQNIYALLFGDKLPSSSGPTLRNLPQTQEGRNVQFKGFTKTPYADKICEDNLDTVVQYIWQELRLREYITSFSKIYGGGSYFLGIEEKTVDVPGTNYKNKIYETTGVAIPADLQKPFQEKLRNKVLENVYIHNAENSPAIEKEDLVALELHQTDCNGNTCCVLEVAVRYVSGCVFYDEQGPEAYLLENGNMARMPFEAWLEKIKEGGSKSMCKKCKLRLDPRNGSDVHAEQ